jgi:uncharacterized protein YbjT (DUF2867 family)
VADGLAARLTGADAVIDVTQSPSLDQGRATLFFSTVARNLGGAAAAAGVGRSVVLSIIGVDQVLDYGYYVAKLAQEQAAKAYAPGPQDVRAAQFLDFAGQMLDWNRQGDTVTIPDMKIQPVAVEEIARLLVKIADGSESRELLELAGPQPETLAGLVRQVIAHRGEPVTVHTVLESPSMADGACLPGPDAVIAGPDFATWLGAQH